jgi:hypothetical protein
MALAVFLHGNAAGVAQADAQAPLLCGGAGGDKGKEEQCEMVMAHVIGQLMVGPIARAGPWHQPLAPQPGDRARRVGLWGVRARDRGRMPAARCRLQRAHEATRQLDGQVKEGKQERIRDIRTSERQFYRKVMDIYATSMDYDPAEEATRKFYATVQNKLHFAITGHTAAELIGGRASSEKPNMGLTNWPGDRILPRDVTIAKNYLNEDELKHLKNIVEQYLAFAESQALRKNPMRMLDWIDKLHGFLTLNEREVLEGLGDHAPHEYQKFHAANKLGPDHESDFDKVVKRLKGK